MMSLKLNLDSIGSIPKDFDGVYLRNTENQIHEPIGRFHPFDGDGLCTLLFFKWKADYRNKFVRTEGFQIEQKFNSSKWAGLMERLEHLYCLVGELKVVLKIHLQQM